MNHQVKVSVISGAVLSGIAALTYLWWTKANSNKKSESKYTTDQSAPSKIPTEKTSAGEAVNYHITRQCNYACGFCFHTSKTSHVEPLERAKEIVRLLRTDLGFKKINFAGGEPFLEPKLLGELCKYAKEVCCYESVSIISNGSKITENWLRKHGKFVDILGVSCDSFNEETNIAIGRGKGKHITSVKQVAKWCDKYHIQFKLNTVVNQYNLNEDMSSEINELNPMRWKIFQVLPLEGENCGQDAKRNDLDRFLITSEQFQTFLQRQRNGLLNPKIMKVEENDVMQSSYVVVDEFGRFLDSSHGSKSPTKSILKVGAQAAWDELMGSDGQGYNATLFYARDGHYADSSWSTDKSSVEEDIEDLLVM